MLKCNHVLSTDDIDAEDLSQVLQVAKRIHALHDIDQVPSLLHNKILGTMFFEPSTRTRLSFESAMLKLGGSVISVSDGESTSAKKGESLSDTGRVVSCYTDILVMRHPTAFSVAEFANFSKVPVINAGDGPNQHPTQALQDLYTIYTELGRLEDITITFLGDLKFGRTVHSLVQFLKQFKVTFQFVSARELSMPEDLVKDLKANGHTVVETDSLEAVLPNADVLYVTRIQGERFASQETFEALKDRYQVRPETLKIAKDNMIVMHPLPRVNEIHPDVDQDPRACYFRQVQNGLYVRMALLTLLLGKAQVLI